MSTADQQPEEDPTVVEARLPTVRDTALLEYGKQLVLESPKTTLDFHKTMLEVSATFGTLITTLVPIVVWGNKDEQLPMPEGWLLIVPPIVMLLSSVMFACGYFPQHDEINVSIIESIEKSRARVLLFRKVLAVAGLFMFVAAILLTVVITLGLRAWATTHGRC